MKKKISAGFVCIFCVLIILSISACDNDINYSIYFDTNGGTEVEPIKTDGESEISMPDNPTKEGYVFDGWYWDDDVFEDRVTEESLSDVTSDVTVYAKWVEDKFTIEFDSNGGSEIDSVTGDIGTEITEPLDPTKDGYDFDGWYTDENLTQSYDFTKMPNEDATVYAKWEPKIYDIDYILNGGTNDSANPATYTVESDTISLNSPTKEYFDFLGWYSEDTFDNEVTEITSESTGDLNLYAKWEIILESENFTYFNHGGELEVIETTLTSGEVTVPAEYNGLPVTVIGESLFEGSNIESIILPESLVYIDRSAFKDCSNLTDVIFDEDDTFEGWYSDKDLTEQYTFGEMLDESITLYAKWQNLSEGIEFTVSHVDYNETLDSYDPETDWGYSFEKNYDFSIDMRVHNIYSGHPLMKMGNSVFENSGLVNINLPNAVNSIGSSAFQNCDSLVDITLPESLILMGADILKECDSLTTVTVERAVDHINDWMGTHGSQGMFDGSTNLSTIYVYRENNTVPWWSDDWDDLVSDYGAQDGLMIYKIHPHWNNYEDIIEQNPNEEPPQDV